MAYKSTPDQDQHELNGAIANNDGAITEPYQLNGAIADNSVTPEEFEQQFLLAHKVGKQKLVWLTPTLVGMGMGVVLAVGGMRFVASGSSSPKASAPVQATPAPPSMTVTTAAVVTTSVVRTLDATGTVAVTDLLPVLPQTIGLQIKQVLAKEGKPVQKGKVMAVLDDSVLQTQITGAQAQLEAAKATVQQKQAALEQAQASLTQAQAALEQAQADRSKAQANYGDARARFKDAQTNLQRYQYLAKQGAISGQDLDTRKTTAQTAAEAVRVAEAGIRSAEASISNAKANVLSAQANIGSAKANVLSAQADVRNNIAKVQQIKTQLGQTLVVAPGSGIVVAPTADGRCDVNASSGMGTTATQSIAPSIAHVGDTSGNKALFCIISNSSLELQVRVPEAQLGEVNIGASVDVTSNADNRIRLQGTVREVAPMVDSLTRQATVKIDVPSNSLLKPGMFLKAAIASKTAQALAVPATALQHQADGKPFVYLLDANNIAHAQTVEEGTTIGKEKDDTTAAKTEIKSGLKTGDRVVVSGAGYLKDGDKVQVAGGG